MLLFFLIIFGCKQHFQQNLCDLQCQLLISDSCMEIAENIILNSKSEAKILKTENASGSVFYIPESIAENMKTENRKPVLYIIADISKDSTITKHDIISTADYVKQNNAEIDSVSICYTNYLPNEGEVLSIQKLIDKLDVAEIEEFKSKKGGFFYKKAIQKNTGREIHRTGCNGTKS